MTGPDASNGPVERRRSTTRPSPMATRNSSKSIGLIVMRSTFPTGNDPFRARATPSRDPAAATWYPGVSSQKYLRDVMASGQAWISSSITRVLPSTMSSPFIEDMSSMILDGLRSRSNTERIPFSDSRLTYTVLSNRSSPNFLRRYVFPDWRTPLIRRGILFSLSFHAMRSL